MNRQRRLFSLLAVSFTATLALAGCGAASAPGGGSTGASSDGTVKLGFISSANNYWGSCLQKGVETAAADGGAELLVANSDADATKETANIEDMIVQGVDAIVLNTVSVDSMMGGIDKATAANVPVYLVAVVPEDMSDVLGATIVDLGGVGALAADWISDDAAGKDVSVGVIAGAPGASSDFVVKGFTGALAANVEVVAEQPGMYNRAKAQEVAENIAQSEPDLDYLFVLNEDMAAGARVALDGAGLADTQIVTMNGTEDGLAAIEAGQFSATISDSASLLGASSVKNTLALLEDSAGEKVFSMPTALITADNIGEAEPFCG